MRVCLCHVSGCSGGWDYCLRYIGPSLMLQEELMGSRCCVSPPSVSHPIFLSWFDASISTPPPHSAHPLNCPSIYWSSASFLLLIFRPCLIYHLSILINPQTLSQHHLLSLVSPLPYSSSADFLCWDKTHASKELGEVNVLKVNADHCTEKGSSHVTFSTDPEPHQTATVWLNVWPLCSR